MTVSTNSQSFHENLTDHRVSVSLQGVEVIINASSLEDIDPMAIGQRLTNGTAAVASPVLSRLKTRDEEHADVVQRETCTLFSYKNSVSLVTRALIRSSVCPGAGHGVREDQRRGGDEENQ